MSCSCFLLGEVLYCFRTSLLIFTSWQTGRWLTATFSHLLCQHISNRESPTFKNDLMTMKIYRAPTPSTVKDPKVKSSSWILLWLKMTSPGQDGWAHIIIIIIIILFISYIFYYFGFLYVDWENIVMWQPSFILVKACSSPYLYMMTVKHPWMKPWTVLSAGIFSTSVCLLGQPLFNPFLFACCFEFLSLLLLTHCLLFTAVSTKI